MTKNQRSDQVGDRLSPPLKAEGRALRTAADQAQHIEASAATRANQPAPMASLASALKNDSSSTVPVASCLQTLWFSFFFDGTGNNREADVGTLKHSSIARLYRVHSESDEKTGIYRVYVPGVGTYFKDIGDKGGSTLGLGTGHMGQERMDWALKEFDKLLKKPLARAKEPSNTIVEINIAVFGFSRGAALARAFTNLLLDTRCVEDPVKGWCLRTGRYRLRVRFMGLFDTVASVGLPMSTNTTSTVGTVAGSVGNMISTRLKDWDYVGVRPANLAFAEHAQAGADPAPGRYDGHDGWGSAMHISVMVEEVRHFVAAHEMRNSFPVDSVSVLRKGRIGKPVHFYETVYPGVHSDVGGSYRPGEGARGAIVQQKLGLIPLRHMYQHALARGVPLLPETAWKDFNRSDFTVAGVLLDQYNYYASKVGPAGSLGQLLNAHMGLYFAWRFHAIRRKEKGDRTETEQIVKTNHSFKKDEEALKQEIAPLHNKNEAALRNLELARSRRTSHINHSYANPDIRATLQRIDDDIAQAKEKQAETQDALLKAQARLNALPDMSNFQSMLDMYDKQLLADARAIYEVYSKPGAFGGAPSSARRKDLRPHYKAMMEAYENEYIYNKGLSDATLIAFFDNYVHDSLVGFAKDATLPSDPRVVYLGGDEKYQYATIEHSDVPGFEYSRVA